MPSREFLLDPFFVADRLGSIFGHSVSTCSIRRAEYRVGENLRVVYDVIADGREFVTSARTFTDSAAAFERTRASAEPVDGMPGMPTTPRPKLCGGPCRTTVDYATWPRFSTHPSVCARAVAWPGTSRCWCNMRPNDRPQCGCSTPTARSRVSPRHIATATCWRSPISTTALAREDVAADARRLGDRLADEVPVRGPLPSEADLRWFTAAAFVAERAIRAVVRINESTLAVLPELLALGQDVLAGKGSLVD